MRFFVFAFILLFAAAPADAQFRRDKRFAKKGDLALMASVRGLDNLQLSQAIGGVGVRYRLADQTVAGLSIGLGLDDRDAGGSPQGSRDRTSVNGQATVWLEQHLGRPRRAVSPFVGFGSQVSLRQIEVEQRSAFDPCGDRTLCDIVQAGSRQEYERWQVGAAALVGAEVRIAGGVTLGAAYGLGGGYFRTTNTQERFGRDEGPFTDTEDGLYFGTSLSEVVLSVYL